MARNLHQTPEVSVLVPVMNEQGNIRPLIDEIAAVYDGRAFEIIYVNDASNDGTAADLTAAQKDVPELRVIHHQNRSGQSAAVRTALLASRAPLIAVLDGDGQNIPADLPALEAALLDARPALGMAGGVRVTRKDSAVAVKWQQSCSSRRSNDSCSAYLIGCIAQKHFSARLC